MLWTEFVFSSLVSQLFETKNSGFPCASAIFWLCSSTSRTVIPKRARSSFKLLPGCIDLEVRIIVRHKSPRTECNQKWEAKARSWVLLPIGSKDLNFSLDAATIRRIALVVRTAVGCASWARRGYVRAWKDLRVRLIEIAANQEEFTHMTMR